MAPKTAAFGVYLNGCIPVGAYHVEVFLLRSRGRCPESLDDASGAVLDSAFPLRRVWTVRPHAYAKHRKVQVKDGGEYVNHHAAVRKGSGRWRIRDKDASGLTRPRD